MKPYWVVFWACTCLSEVYAQYYPGGTSYFENGTLVPPINDLGTGTFLGRTGGLYPGGSNVRPAAHEAAGLSIASHIVPRDSSGNPDPVNGKIVMASLGMSNTTQEFEAFLNLVAGTTYSGTTVSTYPYAIPAPGGDLNPKLLVLDGAQGGQGAGFWADPTEAPATSTTGPTPWYVLRQRLQSAGAFPNQLQVVWIKLSEPVPSQSLDPIAWATTLKGLIKSTILNLKSKYPNVGLVYLSSRIYGGYSLSFNNERYAYESGFAVKSLIEDQISGADLAYGGSNPAAPWLSWGPYLWANGRNPRSDGLTWEPTDFQSTDGIHPALEARKKVSQRLMDFLKTDSTSMGWFLANPPVGGTSGTTGTGGGGSGNGNGSEGGGKCGLLGVEVLWVLTILRRRRLNGTLKGGGMRHARWYLIVLTLTCCGGAGSSQPAAVPAGAAPANDQSPLGTNLAFMTYWNSELPFKDLFKQCSDWIPQQVVGGPWNTGLPFAGYTADGYPLLSSGQAALTMICPSLAGHYPGGAYAVLYDGQGTLEFGGDAVVSGQSPGRTDLVVTPANAGIRLRIIATDPTDPIHNIRVVPHDYEASYASSPFAPRFLARWSRFKLLRFMHWQQTVGSSLVNWDERTTPTYFSQGTRKGVALEFLIQLANTLHADAWFCIPHQATDDFVTKFAMMVRDNLAPDLKAYVEYSNEVWNGAYSEAQYAQQQGLALGLSSNPFTAQLRFYSQRSVEIFNLWQQAFGTTARFVRVLAVQNANPWTGTTVMDWQNAWQHADALAVAPYFGSRLGNPNFNDPNVVAQMTVPQVLDYCAADFPVVLSMTAQHASNAEARGLPLIAYEGGQELVAQGTSAQNPAIVQLFADANRAAGMGTIYSNFLPAWKNAGGRLFVQFTSVTKYDSWGSFGTLEWDDQATAPKYEALLDFIQKNPRWW